MQPWSLYHTLQVSNLSRKPPGVVVTHLRNVTSPFSRFLIEICRPQSERYYPKNHRISNLVVWSLEIPEPSYTESTPSIGEFNDS